jgi:hypothetical protein
MQSGIAGTYTDYGYAGFSYETYDDGCFSTITNPDAKFENTIANGELMIAAGVLGADNAIRDRAWDPGLMWGWADPLVQKATQALYDQVFTVFGAITLVVVGVYLLWRSRQANMSAALTTAAWAVFIMIVVTALAHWPVYSAHAADRALITSLDSVHNAVGPPVKTIPPNQCLLAPKDCVDQRTPSERASDTAVDTLLYRNWLRGMLGSDTSATAIKYGRALYDAKSLSWSEEQSLQTDPALHDSLVARKNDDFKRLASQIKSEDPTAYDYLSGTKGMDRIGAGLIALISSLLYSFFDILSSLLVLLGFLLFRWAVIAAPLLGTVAIFRPASAGFRRLTNAVVAAVFNIVIFGTASGVYLFAVDLIMNTSTLPGWLQMVLVGLCGAIGWLLLRPFRRLNQLTGGTAPAALALASRPFANIGGSAGKDFASAEVLTAAPAQRVETRPEAPPPGTPAGPSPIGTPPSVTPARPSRAPAPSGPGWSEPASQPVPEYALYRPGEHVESDSAEIEIGRRAEARQDG